MPDSHKITTPLSAETVAGLSAGDEVSITGIVYTARDQAHRLLVKAIEKGEALPLDLQGQVVFYAGPTPGPGGNLVGAIGPTTSSRLDEFTPTLLEHGLKGMIGKGRRSDRVKESIQRYQAVYLAAIGGVAAFFSRFIVGAEIIAYQDLGPEAIYRLEVRDFPALVAIDSRGNDYYEQAVWRYQQRRGRK